MKKIVLLLLLILGGCVQPIKTEVDVSEISPFIEFNVNKMVALKNVQSSHDKIVVADLDILAITGTKFDLTETLIEITKHELIKRKATISQENYVKELSLSLDSLSCEKGFTGPTCTTEITVTTGSGYSAVYTSSSSNGFEVNSTASHTLAEAVSAMFRDPKVVSYLTEV